MTVLEKLKRRHLFILLLCLVIPCALIVTSCEDDDPEVESLVGTYLFTSAVLSDDLVYNSQVLLPSGTDVTAVVGAGIFGAAPCTNTANAAVELKESNELYFVCISETNEVKAGTWSINDARTVLTLNLSAPPLPLALALELTELVEGTLNISGKIANLPVQGESIPQLQLPVGTILMLTIDIQFTKVP